MPRISIINIILSIVIAACVLTAPAHAQSTADIINGANLLGGLTQSGQDWTGVGAYFSAPPLLETTNQTTVGTYHYISVGVPATIKLFLGDPENRARIVRWEIVNSQTGEIQSGETECQDSRIVEIPVSFSEPGVYLVNFYLTSKVRGAEQFLMFRWNEARQRITNSSTMVIFVDPTGSIQPPPTPSLTLPESNLSLRSGQQDFGSAPNYYVSGIDQLAIQANRPTDWVVSGPGSRENFSNEEFLIFQPEHPGIWRFESGGSVMTIVVISVGSSRAEADSSSDVDVNYCTNGNLTININSQAHAAAESKPAIVIAFSLPEIQEEVQLQQFGWGDYQPQMPSYYLGIPNQFLQWYWDQGTQDWTCGPPPSDWGWQPPVPPPPSSGWAPEVPPVP